MVGVPRSRGCHLCVKRRVKCDERVPGCVKCERYGQPCPGYDKGFKFIAGKPYRTRRRPHGTEDAHSENGSFSTTTPSASASSSASDSGSDTQVLQVKRVPVTIMSVDLNVLQSLSALVNEFTSPHTPESPNYVSASWFTLLPAIYGQNRALDATIKSFAAQHFGRSLQNKQMILYAQSTYGEALHWLRKSLMNPPESLSSNVFCAVVLLCMYELFTSTEDPESWMKHAKGLGQLVKARGPDRYRNQLDVSLLKSARGLIVMHSMFSGEECFLAANEWHEMMQQQHMTSLSQEYHDSIEQFFAYFTHSPKIVHNLYRLREKEFSDPEILQEVSEALALVLDMQKNLDSWYETWSQISSPPVETPSILEDVLFPTVLIYADLLDASIYCGYYAYRIIIHEALRAFGYPGPQGDIVAHFRDQICKSLEYAAVGILGPYRIGFAIRVAIETADPTTRLWLLSRLQEFSKTYAAAKPENYKPIT